MKGLNFESPLRNENILLRGCTLKLATVVYGMQKLEKILKFEFEIWFLVMNYLN